MDANGAMPPRVLLADDQLSVLKALRLLLKGEGFEIETAASATLVLEAIGRQDFDVEDSRHRYLVVRILEQQRILDRGAERLGGAPVRRAGVGHDTALVRGRAGRQGAVCRLHRRDRAGHV